MVYISSANKELIFDAVRAMYTDIARDPARGYHVPTGHAACTFVGYPAEQLARLPASAVESFAGVGYPFAANVIRAGDTVLDIGSGSGTDVLLAAQAVGPSGQVIGLDLTTAMLAKLEASVAAAGLVERARAGGKRRAPSASRCFRGCRHEQRRPQSRAGQACGLCGNPPRAEAGWTPADRRHRAGPSPLRRLRLRSPASGRSASSAPRWRTSISRSSPTAGLDRRRDPRAARLLLGERQRRDALDRPIVQRLLDRRARRQAAGLAAAGSVHLASRVRTGHAGGRISRGDDTDSHG